MNTQPVTPRPYRLGKRAAAAQRTTDAIVDAALAFIPARSWEDLTIGEIADRAGVTERTVLRHFSTKDDVARACSARAIEQVRAQRRGAPGTSLDDAVTELVAHYEERGDTALWLLDHARRVPVLAEAAADGSAMHEDWVRGVFGEPVRALGLDAPERRQRMAALSAATDVHTWHILRRRSGLTRRDTEAALRTMCAALLRPEGADR